MAVKLWVRVLTGLVNVLLGVVSLTVAEGQALHDGVVVDTEVRTAAPLSLIIGCRNDLNSV
jgi:hypothetical protein